MPDKMADSLADVPDGAMRCSFNRRHEESVRHDEAYEDAKGRIVEVEVYRYCDLCGHESWTLYHLPGWTVMRRRAAYPPDYLVKGGVTAAERKDEYLRRRFPKSKFEESPPKVSAGKRGAKVVPLRKGRAS